jgi:hypothetical protein
MDIHYKILEVNPNEHAIVVRYFSDVLSEEQLVINAEDPNRRDDGSPWRCRTDYNLNLPVPAPVGEELHKFIVMSAPIGWFDMQHKVVNPDIDTSLSHITELVDQHITITGEDIFKAFNVEVSTNELTGLYEEPTGPMTEDDIVELLKKAAAGQVG